MRALLCGLLLVIAVSHRATPAEASESRVRALVTQRTAALELLHLRARKTLVMTAHDGHFDDYFRSPSPAERELHKQAIDGIALQVQRQFHAEEMCLIDSSGATIARIAHGRVADDLRTDRGDAIYFRPGLALAPRDVHISPIYLSETAAKWVVAYVTPIVVDGLNRAMLHYEYDLAFFQHYLSKPAGDGGEFLVVVTAADWVIADSRRKIATVKRGRAAQPEAYFDRVVVGGRTGGDIRRALGDGQDGEGQLTIDGVVYAVAFRSVEDWTLFAFAPK